MSAQHWPGDSGDVVNSLWRLNIDRVIADAAEVTLNMVGNMTGMGDIGTRQRELGDWLDNLTHPEHYTDPAPYTATARGTA